MWQNPEEIFLSQGKYVVEILKRFKTLDCKAIATPLASNLKLLCDPTSETVNATIYRQMIGSLMYLTNTRPYIFFAVNTLIQYMVELIRVHMVATKHMLR